MSVMNSEFSVWLKSHPNDTWNNRAKGLLRYRVRRKLCDFPARFLFDFFPLCFLSIRLQLIGRYFLNTRRIFVIIYKTNSTSSELALLVVRSVQSPSLRLVGHASRFSGSSTELIEVKCFLSLALSEVWFSIESRAHVK